MSSYVGLGVPVVFEAVVGLTMVEIDAIVLCRAVRVHKPVRHRRSAFRSRESVPSVQGAPLVGSKYLSPACAVDTNIKPAKAKVKDLTYCLSRVI